MRNADNRQMSLVWEGSFFWEFWMVVVPFP
jgi:hypothetical protein